MASVVKRITLVMAALLLVTMTATAANNAEQVVFSTPGSLMNLTGNSKTGVTPFGFWIWCAASAAPGSKGEYQNANACQGSMYFYLLDKHATPVIGFVTEDAEGIYTMHVWEGTFPELRNGTLFTNASYNCTLTNQTEDSGPVDVHCSFKPALGGGTGDAEVSNVVVNVTGP